MNTPTPIPFGELLTRACNGCEASAQELYQQCHGDLMKAIRHQLQRDGNARVGYDSDDFLQSVWGSFFRESNRRIFGSPRELVAFLRRVARNKVKDASREVDQDRVRVRLDELHPEDPPTFLASEQPSPSQEMIAEEAFDAVLSGQQSETTRRILVLLRKGFRQREIARTLGISEARVSDLIKKIKTRRNRDAPQDGGTDGV